MVLGPKVLSGFDNSDDIYELRWLLHTAFTNLKPAALTVGSPFL